MIEPFGHIIPTFAPLASSSLICVVDADPESMRSTCQVFRDAKLPTRGFTSTSDFLKDGLVSSPCCVVVEPGLQGRDGFELQRSLDGSAVQFVFLSSRADVPMCVLAMKAGAVDFLTKPAPPAMLLDAVARALARSKTIIAAQSVRAAALARISSLTSRESAVMHRVVAGLLNKQIAVELGIAEKTIKVHRGRVMRKTGAVSVPDLVRLAITAGISQMNGNPVAA